MEAMCDDIGLEDPLLMIRILLNDGLLIEQDEMQVDVTFPERQLILLLQEFQRWPNRCFPLNDLLLQLIPGRLQCDPFVVPAFALTLRIHFQQPRFECPLLRLCFVTAVENRNSRPDSESLETVRSRENNVLTVDRLCSDQRLVEITDRQIG